MDEATEIAVQPAIVEDIPGLEGLEDPRFFDRELSWLAFNERVLQEAEDPDVPLAERLLFLAIFSSNLDEFFRVRVAAIRSVLLIKKKKRKKLQLRPRALLRKITRVVTLQQERFGRIFREQVMPALAERGVTLLDETRLTDAQGEVVRQYFDETVRPLLTPVLIPEDGSPPFLKDHTVYLVVELSSPEVPLVGEGVSSLVLLEVPSPELPRFFEFDGRGGGRGVLFLDDVIRYNLPRMFPDDRIDGAWAIKISRDADLYLEDELGTSLKERIRKALTKRDRGMPVRFLYDLRAPHGLLARLQEALGLAEEDIIDGGRYHNLNQLGDFPVPDDPDLRNPPFPPVSHPELADARGRFFDLIRERDRFLRFPYQSYEPVIDFLGEAAEDPSVEEIWISLYRVASNSRIAGHLIDAARRGKKVTVFVEVQARFDEQSNIDWADRMEAAGVRTLYGTQGIKVHAKIALVRRREGDYAYLGTGNFNEKTARIYADHALLTADERLTPEVHRVFQALAGDTIDPEFEHLLVAPFTMRTRFEDLIAAELQAALVGAPSGITAKMNSLQDRPMIERLYGAAQVGVPVNLIIRGICCARPGMAGIAEGMHARSIVDRFLEHSRIYHFHAEGADRLYLASADWMNRNLNRRVEVAFPIYDPEIRAAIFQELEIQLADDVKARILDEEQQNHFAPRGDGPPVRAQSELYRIVAGRQEP